MKIAGQAAGRTDHHVFVTGSAIVFLIVMAYVFVLDFPAGLLQTYVDLPWPLR